MTEAPRAILEIPWGRAAVRKALIAPGDRLTVGRSAPARVVVPHDRQMSGVHFELSWDGERCRIRDLGSAMGTWLDGQQITEADVELFLREINSACPGAGLSRGDVLAVLGGMLPEIPRQNRDEEPAAAARPPRPGNDECRLPLLMNDPPFRATGSSSTPACLDAGVQPDADPSPAVPSDAGPTISVTRIAFP